MRYRFLSTIIFVLCLCVGTPALAATKKAAPKPLINQRAPVKKASVKKKTVKIKVAPNPRVTQLLIASAKELRLLPGEAYTVRLGFKNTGKIAWKKAELRADGPDVEVLQHQSWAGKGVLSIPDNSVNIGGLQFFDFTIQAPEQPGAYFLSGTLYADGKEVVGGTFGLPIEVAPDEASVVTEQLKPEPDIRVALGTIEAGALVRAVGDYDFVNASGTPLISIPDGSRFFWQYDKAGKTYLITKDGVATSSPELYRLQAHSPDSRFIIHDLSDSPKWNKGLNYNEFRGSMELRWSDKMVGLWVINELPFEYYLKGLIETGNSDPVEFQKATYIAARSYAYVQLPDGKSYPNRLWDVHALWDQVYKGYAAEKTNPKGVQSVDATRGTLVTYQGRPVVTPYFTRSDGATRSWKQVWGGTDKPWLQPVDAPYDHGKRMWGHGVGMSAMDAKAHAKKDGWTAEQILEYYYTGITLRKVFG